MTLNDVARPETVQAADPADLTASFGPGVNLKSVTPDVTKEPVIEGRHLKGATVEII